MFYLSHLMQKELKYDLYGVVEHSGSPSYGHYVCSVRSSPSTWHLMNDSHVCVTSYLLLLFFKLKILPGLCPVVIY